MKFNLLGISLLAISLTACSFSESKKDNQIDPKIKNQIHVLNNRIVSGFVENNSQKVLVLCSDRLRDKRRDIKKLMDVLKGNLKMQNFRILNEYYQKNTAKKNVGEVGTDDNPNHDYRIKYQAGNKEIYVVVADFEDSLYQKSFTFIYGKYGDDWKLNNLQAGIIKIRNKDAFDWYQVAKSDYQKGYFIDAICHIGLSTQLLKPGNQLWKYKNEDEIQSFEQKITKQIYGKYKFPLTVNDVETKPVIFRVYSQIINTGCFPLVLYTTSIDLKDIPALSLECREIHKNIGRLFKGIDINNSTILYQPSKTATTDTEPTRSYGFMMKTQQSENGN